MVSVLLMVSPGTLVLTSGLSCLAQCQDLDWRQGLTSSGSALVGRAQYCWSALWFVLESGFSAIIGVVVSLDVGVWRHYWRLGTALVRCQAQHQGSTRCGVWVWCPWDWHRGTAQRQGVAAGLALRFGSASGFSVGLGVQVQLGVVVRRQGLAQCWGLVLGVGVWRRGSERRCGLTPWFGVEVWFGVVVPHWGSDQRRLIVRVRRQGSARRSGYALGYGSELGFRVFMNALVVVLTFFWVCILGGIVNRQRDCCRMVSRYLSCFRPQDGLG